MGNESVGLDTAGQHEVDALLATDSKTMASARQELYGTAERREATLSIIRNLMTVATTSPDVTTTKPWHFARRYITRKEIAPYLRHVYGVSPAPTLIAEWTNKSKGYVLPNGKRIVLQGSPTWSAGRKIYSKAAVDRFMELLLSQSRED